MKFFNFRKKKANCGSCVPTYTRHTIPPMPKTAPCKSENDFPDFDMLHSKTEDVLHENKRKSFNRLIDNISEDMKASALCGSFRLDMIIRQGDYTGLDLSDPDSVDCQDIRDYILSKDSRFTIIIEPLSDVYKDCWLKDDGVKLTVKWC